MGQMHACHLCSLPERQEANRSPQPIPTALQHCSEEQFSSMESSSATQKAGIHTGATPVCAQLTSLFISPSAKFKHCNLLRGALTESLQKDRAQADQDWPCKVFLTSLHWAWPASENSISRCFMKAFFFLLFYEYHYYATLHTGSFFHLRCTGLPKEGSSSAPAAPEEDGHKPKRQSSK